MRSIPRPCALEASALVSLLSSGFLSFEIFKMANLPAAAPLVLCVRSAAAIEAADVFNRGPGAVASAPAACFAQSWPRKEQECIEE
jgi:hypothetical protein